MKLNFFGATDVGQRRKNNEDYFGVFEPHSLFVVADGMGGHAAGEVASSTAVLAVAEFVALTEKETDITWPWGVDPNLSLVANRLKTAVRFGNQKVLDLSLTQADYEGMATTIVGVLLEEGTAHIAHVGDSRLYLINDSGIRQVTVDHSWVLEQVALGVLTNEQARSHPLRNVVTRAIGASPDLNVEITAHEMAVGDVLLMCSDGLSGMVLDADLERIVRANADPKKAAELLIAEANSKGGEDNITVLLVKRDE
ncbi:MAG: Stp1/IreP family PP2C-type Ser/Thr phosphatase [Vicinamibacteria bacterium]|nr:Stp1/IreP family PP2C-type Ser/Thr phosphatase [Vicinamibacteria bacterium]